MDDYERKKEKLERILNEEKKIKEITQEKSQIAAIIKKYKIKILNENSLTDVERVMSRC